MGTLQFILDSSLFLKYIIHFIPGSALVSLRNKDTRQVYFTDLIFTTTYQKFFLFTIRGSYYAVEFVFFRSPWNAHFKIGGRRAQANYDYVSYYARAE